MRHAKYRRGIRQKGKYWQIPDSWKGPFHSNDKASFSRGEKGQWKLVVDIIRNDGDGPVLLAVEPKQYQLPKWLQGALERVYKDGVDTTKYNMMKVCEIEIP